MTPPPHSHEETRDLQSDSTNVRDGVAYRRTGNKYAAPIDMGSSREQRDWPPINVTLFVFAKALLSVPYNSFRSRATGIPSCSRYFATVRLAIS